MVALRSPFWANDPRDDPRIKDETLKKRFAAETLRNKGMEFSIAFAMIPEANVAQCAVNAWNTDIVVLNERARLHIEHGEQAELPTKETVMLEVLAIARAEKHNVPDRLKAYSQYSDMMGYTGRNMGVQPVAPGMTDKVMLVRDFGTDEEHEAAAIRQQNELIENARNDRERAETVH